MTQSRAHWEKPNPQKQKQDCYKKVSFPGFPDISVEPLETAMWRLMKRGSNWWCLFCRLGAPEQSPDVLQAEPWDRGVLCAHPSVLPTNSSTPLGKELGRAGRHSYVVGSPKNQFEVPAFPLGSGLRFGPQVCVSFGLAESWKHWVES